MEISWLDSESGTIDRLPTLHLISSSNRAGNHRFNMITPVILLFISNIFMTFAWYGHLQDARTSPLWMAILVSWSIAFLEYCFLVPGNRIGAEYFSITQLKVMQEIITMIVFAGFSVFYLQVPITRNYVFAGMLLAGAAYLIFTERS